MYDYNKENFYKDKKYIYKSEKILKLTHQLIDAKTGEILKEQIENRYIKNSKKGWCKVYPKDFAEAVMELKSKFSVDLYMYFMKNGYFKKDGTLKNFKQLKLAKELGTTRQRISRAIKDLENSRFIAKINDEWRYNPFYNTPAGMSDKEIQLAQDIWEKEVGYYVFKK